MPALPVLVLPHTLSPPPSGGTLPACIALQNCSCPTPHTSVLSLSFSSPFPQDEELKEAVSETIQAGIQQGKEAFEHLKEDPGDELLSVALLVHAEINLWQVGMLLWCPQQMVPGLGGIEMKFHGSSQWSLLRCLAFQTLAIGLAAGGAAFKYSTKDKVILNSVVLAFHVMTLSDMVYNKWYKDSGFSYNPAYFHLPMLALHTVALLGYNKVQAMRRGMQTRSKTKRT